PKTTKHTTRTQTNNQPTHPSFLCWDSIRDHRRRINCLAARNIKSNAFYGTKYFGNSCVGSQRGGVRCWLLLGVDFAYALNRDLDGSFNLWIKAFHRSLNYLLGYPNRFRANAIELLAVI